MHSSQTAQRKHNATKIASAFLVTLSVLLQWYAHQGGLLTTPDSCNYLAAANSFKNNFTFLSYDGGPYVYWPPLFPVILSVFGDGWYWIQLLITGWIGMLVVIETRKSITDPLLQVLCQASILLSVHLLLIGVFLWSELLFLLLLMYFTKAVEKNFIAAIILGFFLCLQRNAGLFFVVAACLWLWDWKRSPVLFLLSTSGFFAWNIYSAAASEQSYFLSLSHNFNIIARAMMHSLAPVPGFFFVVVAGILAYILRADHKARLPGLMILIYMLGITVLFPLLDSDDDRYAAVVIPFLMILIFRAVEIALSKQTSALRIMLMIVIVCWLAYPFSRTLKNAFQWHNLSFTSYFCAIQLKP